VEHLSKREGWLQESETEGRFDDVPVNLAGVPPSQELDSANRRATRDPRFTIVLPFLSWTAEPSGIILTVVSQPF